MATVFKLNPEPTFKVTAAIPVPGLAAMELEVEFRHKTRDELVKFFGGLKGRKGIDILMEIIADWHNCDTPFSKKTLATLLQNYPKSDSALMDAYVDQCGGARMGN